MLPYIGQSELQDASEGHRVHKEIISLQHQVSIMRFVMAPTVEFVLSSRPLGAGGADLAGDASVEELDGVTLVPQIALQPSADLLQRAETRGRRLRTHQHLIYSTAEWEFLNPRDSSK